MAEPTTTEAVAALVAAARLVLDAWDEFSDPSIFATREDCLEATCGALAEYIEPLRSAADLVIPDDLHAWCVTAEQYEAALGVARYYAAGWRLNGDRWELGDRGRPAMMVDVTDAQRLVIAAVRTPHA